MAAVTNSLLRASFTRSGCEYPTAMPEARYRARGVVSSNAAEEEHHGGTGRTRNLPENVKKNVSVGINEKIAVGLFARRRYVIWVR